MMDLAQLLSHKTLEIIYRMGPTGFEPVTSSVSGRHHTARLRALSGCRENNAALFNDDAQKCWIRCLMCKSISHHIESNKSHLYASEYRNFTEERACNQLFALASPLYAQFSSANRDIPCGSAKMVGIYSTANGEPPEFHF